jgi:hypothetical protein
MLKTVRRIAGMTGAAVGISILGSGLAFADGTAFVAGGGGRAHYDSSSNVFTVRDTNCDGASVAGLWRWRGTDGPWRAIVDTSCESGEGVSRRLDPPANATGIAIQACHVTASGVLFDCGAIVRTNK